MTKFWRWEIEGKELRRATLDLRSSPCDDPGFTRIEGVLPSAFSIPGSTTELGGRDGARDGARDDGRELGADSEIPV